MKVRVLALVGTSLSVILAGVGLVAQSGQPSSPGGPAVQGAPPAAPQQTRRDAREEWPEAMIGTWILNLEKSTKFSGPRVKSAFRTFDYTVDGQVLISWEMVSQEGHYRFGHWFAKLDGTEGWAMERTRESGSTPSNVASIKLTDPNTVSITARKNGVVIWLGSLEVSQDGKTLHWKLKSTPGMGRDTEVDWIYDKAPARPAT